MRFDYSDHYEQLRQREAFNRELAERDALRAQTNIAVSPAQRMEFAQKAMQANRAYEDRIGANQDNHERNLQGAAMAHKFDSNRLARDLGQMETQREGMKWGAIGNAFGQAAPQTAGGGGIGSIGLYDHMGRRIGGTAQSPLSGLTRR